MLISVCDICKKRIDKAEEISAGFGIVTQTKTFCKKCAKPVANFLNKHGFGKEKSKKS